MILLEIASSLDQYPDSSEGKGEEDFSNLVEKDNLLK